MARTVDAASPPGELRSAEALAEAARVQIDRILADPTFRGSSRRRDLLRFVVEETLAGRADQLKGFTVAVAVFGRDKNFDPGADPVVRLEAGRLRRTLDSYYVDAGKNDALRITIPKGGYVPHFEWRGPETPAVPSPSETRSPDAATPTGPAAASPPKTADPGADDGPSRRLGRRATAAILAAVVLILGTGGAWFWLRDSPPGVADARGPAVIVLPFEALGAGDEARLFASGMTQELITDLMRFPDFRLYSPPASFRQDSAADPVALGRELGVAYVVRGNVQFGPGALRLAAQLADAATGQVLWSDSYDRASNPDDLLGLQSDLSAAVATALGQPYGAVNAATARRMTAVGAPSMQTYACILRAYEYRRAFDDALFAPALTCLQAAVERDPDYADAWAMLGWLHLDAARMDLVPAAEDPAEMAAAFDATSHAVELDRRSQRALEALAAVTFYRGDYAASEALQREALALNPHDPEALAQLGWRLAVRGDWDEGLPFLEQAIARSASPPGWYFHLISIHAYLTGDYAAALAAAEKSSKSGSAIGLSLAAISHAKLGEMDAARAELVAMAEAWPLLGRDPAAAYRTHHADDAIVTALVAGLRGAGWTAPSAPSL